MTTGGTCCGGCLPFLEFTVAIPMADREQLVARELEHIKRALRADIQRARELLDKAEKWADAYPPTSLPPFGRDLSTTALSIESSMAFRSWIQLWVSRAG